MRFRSCCASIYKTSTLPGWSTGVRMAELPTYLRYLDLLANGSERTSNRMALRASARPATTVQPRRRERGGPNGYVGLATGLPTMLVGLRRAQD